MWHKPLGHISKERVERLIKDDILPSLDFNDLETCVDCIRGKFTKTNEKGSTRSLNILEIIHTHISDPLSPTIWGNKSFITFIDEFSRHGYLYLIKEKSEALEKFKIFKTEVEKQLGKVIKVVRYKRGEEYYGIYDSVEQPDEPVEQIHVIRSVRQKRLVTFDDFVIYLSEDSYDVGIVVDPEKYLKVITCS